MAGPCPQRPTDQTTFDVRNATSCVALCGELFQAYINAIAGNKTVTVRFQERWTEYAKPNADALRTLYMTIYTACPAAAAAGLPDLNPAKQVRRGPPARGYWNFPRL